MLPPRDVSPEGLEFTSKWEGLSLKPYKDIAGVWTWGYGHARIGQEPMPTLLTVAEATTLLHVDVAKHIAPIDLLARTVDLEQRMFDALADWLVNVGAGALQYSGVLAAMLRGDYDAVPAELEKWCRVTINGVKVVNQGLLNRRRAEGAMWRAGESWPWCQGMGTCPNYRTHDICPPDDEILARGQAAIDQMLRDDPSIIDSFFGRGVD